MDIYYLVTVNDLLMSSFIYIHTCIYTHIHQTYSGNWSLHFHFQWELKWKCKIREVHITEKKFMYTSIQDAYGTNMFVCCPDDRACSIQYDLMLRMLSRKKLHFLLLFMLQIWFKFLLRVLVSCLYALFPCNSCPL